MCRFCGHSPYLMTSFIDDWVFFSNYQVIGDPNIRIKFIYMYYDINILITIKYVIKWYIMKNLSNIWNLKLYDLFKSIMCHIWQHKCFIDATAIITPLRKALLTYITTLYLKQLRDWVNRMGRDLFHVCRKFRPCRVEYRRFVSQ